MSRYLGPEPERTCISEREIAAFVRIVQLETYRGPRHLIDQWAAPGDTNPHAEHALTLTLAAMWRETERQTQDD